MSTETKPGWRDATDGAPAHVERQITRTVNGWHLFAVQWPAYTVGHVIAPGGRDWTVLFWPLLAGQSGVVACATECEAVQRRLERG